MSGEWLANGNTAEEHGAPLEEPSLVVPGAQGLLRGLVVIMRLAARGGEVQAAAIAQLHPNSPVAARVLQGEGLTANITHPTICAIAGRAARVGPEGAISVLGSPVEAALSVSQGAQLLKPMKRLGIIPNLINSHDMRISIGGI